MCTKWLLLTLTLISRPSIDEMGVPAEPWGRVHDRNQKKFSTQVKSWFTLIKIVIIFVAVSRLVPVRGDCDDGDQHDQDEQHTAPPSQTGGQVGAGWVNPNVQSTWLLLVLISKNLWYWQKNSSYKRNHVTKINSDGWCLSFFWRVAGRHQILNCLGTLSFTF